MDIRSSRRRVRPGAAAGLAVLVVVAAVLAIVLSDDGPPPTEADRCQAAGGHPEVRMDFEKTTANEMMRMAARTLRDDPRVAQLDEQTREQSYDQFKKAFADDPKMLETARLEAIPASLLIRPADDISPERLADDLRAELTTADEVRALPCVATRPPNLALR